MASMPGEPTSSFTKVLLLGAIAAASAFVVTVLVLLLCMGCQRNRRRRKLQADGERYSLVNAVSLPGTLSPGWCPFLLVTDLASALQQGALRQSKLRSFSKSDTRLHEMSRLTCNGGGTTKHRPASMDLLYMSSRRSNTDLRLTHPRQLPKAPSGGVEDHEHTYSEVGRRASPFRGLDDGLYESVGGMAGEPEGQSPAHALAGDPGPPDMAAAPQDPVMAEYASIRKVRKADRSPRREGGARSQQAPPPPDMRSHEAPRKNTEPFRIHSFRKETVVRLENKTNRLKAAIIFHLMTNGHRRKECMGITALRSPHLSFCLSHFSLSFPLVHIMPS
uniref:Lck interacting transmembrane adaptor 1 n=1 Tax=Paramormyrops kingsleyae TaxID=1676925 RepID=A0A3B3RP81_9TELE